MYYNNVKETVNKKQHSTNQTYNILNFYRVSNKCELNYYFLEKQNKSKIMLIIFPLKKELEDYFKERKLNVEEIKNKQIYDYSKPFRFDIDIYEIQKIITFLSSSNSKDEFKLFHKNQSNTKNISKSLQLVKNNNNTLYICLTVQNDNETKQQKIILNPDEVYLFKKVLEVFLEKLVLKNINF